MGKEPSKTQQALEMIEKNPGMSPYAAAKLVGVSSTAVYNAVQAREAKAHRPKCPTCGTDVREAIADPVEEFKTSVITALDRMSEQLTAPRERDLVRNIRMFVASENT
jgi:predicted transcriptional regulator